MASSRPIGPRIVNRARATRDRLTSSAVWLELDRALMRLAWRHPRSSTRAPYDHVILTTVGLGNIGDQAMLEAVLSRVSGRVAVVYPRANSGLDAHRSGGMSVDEISLDALIAGPIVSHVRNVFRLGRLLQRAGHLTIVGADIMDGSYDVREAVVRFAILEMSARRGTSARIVGFSWSDHPHRLAARAARRLPASAGLFVRDPQSEGRLRDLGVLGTTATADVVFTMNQPLDCIEAEWLRAWRGSGHKPLIVNVSGLLKDRLGQAYVDGLIDVCRRLLAAGYGILFVPHVLRLGDDDLGATLLVAREFSGSSRIHVVERQLSPAEVQGVAREALGVITGRMHLSILALSQGTPAVVMSSQGKVSGMLGFFNLERLEVDPTRPFVENTVLAIAEAVAPATRESVRIGLPSVIRLAERNFVGL